MLSWSISTCTTTSRRIRWIVTNGRGEPMRIVHDSLLSYVHRPYSSSSKAIHTCLLTKSVCNCLFIDWFLFVFFSIDSYLSSFWLFFYSSSFRSRGTRRQTSFVFLFFKILSHSFFLKIASYLSCSRLFQICLLIDLFVCFKTISYLSSRSIRNSSSLLSIRTCNVQDRFVLAFI
jgi:hypothetical protein